MYIYHLCKNPISKKNLPRIIGHSFVDKLHLDLVEDVLEVVLAGRQLEVVVAVVGALEHDDIAVHQLVQYLAACTRLNPSGRRRRGLALRGYYSSPLLFYF